MTATEPTQYPLSWPDNIPRGSPNKPNRFKSSLSSALKNVQHSLALFSSDSGRKIESIVISSNCTLGVTNPKDPGVAVWFVWDGDQVCFAVDRYSKVEHNLQAIHHIIEARRTELRHGGINIVKATFRGFQALPSPEGIRKKTWREVFGVKADREPTRAGIETRYKQLSKSRHPDSPTGSDEKMTELNLAKQEALREIGGAR